MPQQIGFERSCCIVPIARGVEIDQQLDRIPIAPPLVVEPTPRPPKRTDAAQRLMLARTDQPVEQLGLACRGKFGKALEPFAREARSELDIVIAVHQAIEPVDVLAAAFELRFDIPAQRLLPPSAPSYFGFERLGQAVDPGLAVAPLPQFVEARENAFVGQIGEVDSLAVPLGESSDDDEAGGPVSPGGITPGDFGGVRLRWTQVKERLETLKRSLRQFGSKPLRNAFMRGAGPGRCRYIV